MHVALLGDSIFDNAAYTRGEPDVVSHLRSLLPPPWKATLCAVDGATTSDISSQLASVPDDATHIVVSVGGNDALMNSDLLDTRVSSTAAALELFAERVDRFEAAYRGVVESLLALGRETTLCTIYNGVLPPGQARIARVALSTFNDAILRVAFAQALPVIELRAVCCEPADYANPIEPSGHGGRKIASVIAAAVGARPARAAVSRVFAGETSQFSL
jgi:hypothetical protein